MCSTPLSTRTPREPQKDVLYQVLQTNLNDFLATVDGDRLPAHVVDELRAYLTCGDFAAGAACFACASCNARTFVPFSCKRRGFCHSCCGRRMADGAARLVDQVLPTIPYRQWVLTVPIPVRYLVLARRALVPKILAIFLRVVFGHLRRKAAEAGITATQVGAISVEQRFGEGARCHWHIHALLPDGVFGVAADSLPFHRVAAPTREELAALVVTLRKRLMRLLGRHGLDPEQVDEQVAQGDLLAGWQAAALTGRITVGPRAGWQVTRIGGQPVAMAPRGKGLCADADGVNLHAGVHVPAGQPQRLERLLCYLLRPPLVRERLSLLPDGRVMLRLKRPYADGTEALLLSPHDLIARLCALIPPPRVHLIHYSGVFAPHAALRRQVVPQMDTLADEDQRLADQSLAPAELARTKASRHRRLSWAELMKRTWGLDVLACSCGGRLRLLGFVMDPIELASIQRSLERPASSSSSQLPLALGP